MSKDIAGLAPEERVSEVLKNWRFLDHLNEEIFHLKFVNEHEVEQESFGTLLGDITLELSNRSTLVGSATIASPKASGERTIEFRLRTPRILKYSGDVPVISFAVPDGNALITISTLPNLADRFVEYFSWSIDDPRLGRLELTLVLDLDLRGFKSGRTEAPPNNNRFARENIGFRCNVQFWVNSQLDDLVEATAPVRDSGA